MPSATGTQYAEVGSAKLKLPPGTWEMVGDRGAGSTGMNAVAVHSEAFLQVVDGKVGGIVIVGANASPASGHRSHWTLPGECQLKTGPNLFVDARIGSTGSGAFDCMAIGFISSDAMKDNPLMSAVAHRAESLGGLPKALVIGMFVKTSESLLDAINVEVLLNPTTPTFIGAVRGTGVTGKISGDTLLSVMTAWCAAYRPVVASALP